MTCTCTHPLDAHVIVPVGKRDRIEPCSDTDCPCSNYQETRHG